MLGGPLDSVKPTSTVSCQIIPLDEHEIPATQVLQGKQMRTQILIKQNVLTCYMLDIMIQATSLQLNSFCLAGHPRPSYCSSLESTSNKWVDLHLTTCMTVQDDSRFLVQAWPELKPFFPVRRCSCTVDATQLRFHCSTIVRLHIP
ncbi:hypothetical protein ABZP36_020756 [Zizania latifolia]